MHILSGESIDGKLISTNKEDARRWKAEELIGKLMRDALKYSNRHEKYIDRLLDIYSKIKWTANLKLIRDVLICKSYWKISENGGKLDVE